MSCVSASVERGDMHLIILETRHSDGDTSCNFIKTVSYTPRCCVATLCRQGPCLPVDDSAHAPAPVALKPVQRCAVYLPQALPTLLAEVMPAAASTQHQPGGVLLHCMVEEARTSVLPLGCAPCRARPWEQQKLRTHPSLTLLLGATMSQLSCLAALACVHCRRLLSW